MGDPVVRPPDPAVVHETLPTSKEDVKVDEVGGVVALTEESRGTPTR